ncbi:hypothetical protein PSTEL_13215 [Paenibacillus stellifer]|uniref:Uncharacterized protein n=1 Tax=Paenibacillus stellifer TaxID=169760 RepID=A0A089LUY2_9BACL|nr:sporulation protein Cse60 [Paenibacillus stellifer]AIQ63900.1 hypothetical protein PSTEL_13215 [Paenibacillus stellifer]
MPKVKIFYSESPERLEDDINEFLNGGEVSDVIDIKFSTSAVALPDERHGTADPMGLFSALVFYREKIEPVDPGSFFSFG